MRSTTGAPAAGMFTAGRMGVRRATPMQAPLRFEPNVGQADPRVRFLSRGEGYTLFLTGDGATFDVPAAARPCRSRAACGQDDAASDVVRLAFAGADPAATVEGLEPLPGRSAYFFGRDPARWHRNVGQFARVRYRQLYRGIDVVFYGNQRALEYDLVVGPNGDPRRIALDLGGVRGFRTDASGDLVLATAHGELRQRRPVAYQELGGRRVPVDARYVVRADRRVGFAVGGYDRGAPLVIDPMFGFSTDMQTATGGAVAVDAAGNTYIAGITKSPTYPVELPWHGESDAFIAKYDPAGVLVEQVYLGGEGSEAATGIALDAAGNILVSGTTSSTDFPTMVAAQPTYGGGASDAFVAKLAADGSGLVYSTYLGGSGDEPAEPDPMTPYWPSWGGQTIAVDPAGNAYVTGATSSTDFPTAAALQSTPGYSTDAFVAKFGPNGTVAYSTYLGGRYQDYGHAIAVDAAGRAYVVGSTWSDDFPTAVPFQPANAWTLQPDAYWTEDAFVARIAADGSALDYSTYLGGVEDERAYGVAVDADGNAYVAGQTLSADFPAQSAQQACNGLSAQWGDAFLTKLAPDGTTLAYSTCLGGPGGEEAAYAVAVDAAGRAYVTGHTAGGSDFPLLYPLQATPEAVPAGWDSHDAFVTEFAADGTLAFSTYLYAGQLGADAGYGIAVDVARNVYLTGLTGRLGSGFVARLDAATGLSVADTALVEGNGEGQASLTVRLTSPSDAPVSFDVATIAGTAAAGVDYEDVSVQGVVIAPGAIEATIPVPLHGDVDVEGDETFTVDVSNVVGAAVTQGHATVTLRNDDAMLTVDDARTVEGDGGTHEVTLPVRLSAPLPTPVDFTVRVEGDTATDGQDFIGFTGNGSIPAGATEADFYVVVNGDATPEADETFHVVVSGASGAMNPDATGTVTIRDDDTRLSIADATVIEGNTGTRNASFVVSLDHPTVGPVTFDVKTKDYTAKAGSDYTPVQRTGVTIPAGSTSTTVTVPVIGDTAIEGNESFQVLVSNVGGAVVADGTASGVVRNDDTKLSIADISIAEGYSGTKAAMFTVRLSNVSASPVTFSVATADKTAVAGADYVARKLNGLSIPAGSTTKTFLVYIVGDQAVEPNEAFLANISGVRGAQVADAQAVATIRNDDAVLSVANVRVSEGNSGTKTMSFTVRLSAPLATPVTVGVSTADRTAVAGSDYVALNLTGQVIPSGSTSRVFKVTVKGDTRREANETFLFSVPTMSVGDYASVTIGDWQAIGTIANDD